MKAYTFIRFKQMVNGYGSDKNWVYYKLSYPIKEIDKVKEFLSDARILYDWSEQYRGVTIQHVRPSKLPKCFLEVQLQKILSNIEYSKRYEDFLRNELTNR